MNHRPILIIGGGLAGTALAWRLHERGAPFLLVDRDAPVTASKIAAGLVTPITGMRLTLSWRYSAFHAEALRFYREKEALLGGVFFHETPVVRLLRDEKEVHRWRERRVQPEITPFIHASAGPLVDEAVFANSLGGFEQRPAGWLDTAAWLQASRDFFTRQGAWLTGEVAADALQVNAGSVSWEGGEYESAVFCTGWQAARHPWFDWAPFKSARGTILTLRADLGGERRVISSGCWVVPRADGSARAGPTYEIPFSDPHTPAPEAVAGLESKLRGMVRAGFHVIAEQTAVRPIVHGREALLGRHPGRPRVAILNGLGSKGALRSPWLARHLAEHLLDGAPLEAELDLAAQ